MQAFWDITKRELADARTEARLKDRELEGEQVGAGGCVALALVAWLEQGEPTASMHVAGRVMALGIQQRAYLHTVLPHPAQNAV